MTRGLGRAVATGLLGALAAIVWLALFYGLRPALTVDFDSSPPRLLSGVYPSERDPASGLTFAWTGEQVTLRLPGLDRRVPWQVRLRVRGARQVASENPSLTFSADGLTLETIATTTDFQDVTVTLPVQSDRRGLTLGIRSSATFVPGPSDRRALGVVLDRLQLSPTGIVVPPRDAFAGAAGAAAAIGAAVAMLGVTAGSAIGAAILLAAGIARTVAIGFGPYTGFPTVAGWIGVGIGAVLVLGALVVRIGMRTTFRNTARFAVVVSAAALLLKLLVLLHPDMPIGDALFHAHRFQQVLGGDLFFTSIAPGNYLFPYAPGLYVVASAFADLVPRGTDDMALLRVIATTVDAVAGALLYAAVVRSRGDRRAAACAVALYQLIPLDFGVLAVGNLTNAFAQSLSVIALVMLAAAPLQLRRWGSTLLFAAVVTAAFLSHTSTFAILSVACATVAVLFWWRGDSARRADAAGIAVALLVAVALAVVLYYAHFGETYRTQLSRIGAETAAAAPDAGGRGIATRLSSVPRYLWLYFGVPVLVLAAGGLKAWLRRPSHRRLSLAVGGWGLACLAFLVVGIVTPVDMRYYLAAIPAAAIVAGLGASEGWSAGGYLRAASGALLAWAMLEGVSGWWAAIG
ncbi:MAG: hypothetical protein ABIX28_03070 [Vicinamibacterales bacterium]